ncbi:hypothetical protein BD413DRAFT_614361 [Trametes elegans]|nr:hypothetical protein BD413DRAFT_614361 [Trametes elegans]
MLRIATVPSTPRGSPSLSHQPSSPNVDDITVSKLLAHISRLRLRDIRQLSAARLKETASNGEAQHRASSPSASDSQAQLSDDEELAAFLFAKETRALHEASVDDDLLEELLREEEETAYDHAVAIALAEGKEPPPRPTAFFDPGERVSAGVDWSLADPDDESFLLEDDDDDEELEALLDHLATLRRLRSLTEYAGVKPPESRPLTPPPPPPPPAISCTVCGDDIDGTVVQLTCGHAFDKGCAREMFQRATVDETLFPPKCCQGAVKLHEVEQHLDRALLDLYHKKSREFTTVDRVYCHNPACAAFLGPAAAAPATLSCGECDAPGTCAHCKDQTHPGVPCHFQAEDVVLGLGKDRGWQRCPACKHLVELDIGCYHMTCRCSQQFCYLCATPWKQCKCDLFFVPPEDDN